MHLPEKEHGLPAPVTKRSPKKRGKAWGSARAMERGFPVTHSSCKGFLEHKSHGGGDWPIKLERYPKAR